MKKYNIAISVTADVENYGDLLFPVIFEYAMKKRGLDFNYFIFSPDARFGKKALDNSCTIYSINDIEKVHQTHPLDAIVVGGGALLQFADIPVRLPGDSDFTDYRISNSWIKPTLFGFKNNIKVIYNLPQIPYAIDSRLKDITKLIFDGLDLITLRDYVSYENFSALYDRKVPKASVSPDSVCAISKYWTKSELRTVRSKELPSFLNKPYAVLHFNRHKPQNDDKYILKTIDILKENGLNTVLLPLGYTHGDEIALSEFQNLCPECKTFEQKLSIKQMAAVLAGCQMYIGTSFHGAVTALSYGRKAISYNYILPYKNIELFKMFGIEDYVLENAEKMPTMVAQLLKDEQPTKLKNVISAVDCHFDEIFKVITDSTPPKKIIVDYEKLLLDLIPDASRSFISYDFLLDGYQKLVADKQEADRTIDALQIECNEYKRQYNEISEAFWWKATAPARKIVTKLKRRK